MRRVFFVYRVLDTCAFSKLIPSESVEKLLTGPPESMMPTIVSLSAEPVIGHFHNLLVSMTGQEH